MQPKTTEQLRHEIKAATDIRDFIKNNKKDLVLPLLTEYLNQLLSDKGLSKADVVRGSQLSRAYVYQIFSGEKSPSRDKVIALAFGLGLSEDEAQTLLKISGNMGLYARKRRDTVILFALQRGKPIDEVNNLLFEQRLGLLGVPEE